MSTSLKFPNSVPTAVRAPSVAAGPVDAMAGVHIVVAARPATPVWGRTVQEVVGLEPLVPESYSLTPDPEPMVSALLPNSGTAYRPFTVTVSWISRVTVTPAAFTAEP